MIKRALIYTAFALLIAAINYLVFGLKEIEFRVSLLLVYGFVVVSGILFEIVLWKIEDPKKFVVAYMGFSGGKMFASLFVLLIYIFTHRDYMKPFAVSFLFAYFSFTALEISRLLRYFKK